MNLKIGKDSYEIKEVTGIKKFIGLIGKKDIDYGILIKNCKSIHTYFMSEEIDIVGLNNKNCVIYKYEALPKNKIIEINEEEKNVSILELPKHASKSIKIGDILDFDN